MWRTEVSVLLSTLTLPQITCFAAHQHVLRHREVLPPTAEFAFHYGIVDLFPKTPTNKLLDHVNVSKEMRVHLINCFGSLCLGGYAVGKQTNKCGKLNLLKGKSIKTRIYIAKM